MNLDDPKLLQEAAERLGIQMDAIKKFVDDAAAGGKKRHTYYTERDATWMIGNLNKFAELGVTSIAIDSSESAISAASFYQRCRYGLTYIQENPTKFPEDTVKLALRTRLKRRGSYVELHLNRNIPVTASQLSRGVTALPVEVSVREDRLSQLHTRINRYIEAGHVTGKAFIQVAEIELTEEDQQKIKDMVPPGFVCAIAKGRNIVITKVKV